MGGGGSNPLFVLRDAYGFAVRPEHLPRYVEYASIYKEEEQERSGRWADFLEGQAKPEETAPPSDAGETTQTTRLWAQIRPSLGLIASTMSSRVPKTNHDSPATTTSPASPERPDNPPDDLGEDGQSSETAQVDLAQAPASSPSSPSSSSSSDDVEKPYFPWKEKLESLVHGGLPMDLRGELWQAFVGVGARRVEGYYRTLLGEESSELTNGESNSTVNLKWKAQIEKDIPRTFPGHPSLDEDGRKALRRLLTAYALHNPSVGYCQAMNFFAGLLLLMMPEENAFWTLVGIIDDYFDGYYTEEMIDSQVDQLVFEELMHVKFPKLVNHLDYLGVQVAWITGPWFLSIFINMLPWESVLRLWDVLLFDGNRSMLFKTSLALMELYGAALVTTKDAGDAITLLQSLTGSTFDSSQLVLTACVGYQAVNESKLQELRLKHRPSVITAMEEKHALYNFVGSKHLVSKSQSFKLDSGLLMSERNLTDEQYDANSIEELNRFPMAGATKFESVPELKQQVMRLKVDFSRLLEEKRSLIIRAGELETAFMEMVKQDNRRVLSAKVENLEREISELRQNLAVKHEQESVMIQVLVRMEQEHKATEDARLSAEQDAAAQKYAAQMLQDKYEETSLLLAEMEKRAVMAESMLEATLHYHSCQEQHTPTRFTQQDQGPAQDTPNQTKSLPSRPSRLGQQDGSKGESSKTEDEALDMDEA